MEAGPPWVDCKSGKVSVVAVYLATVKAAQVRPCAVPVVVHKSRKIGPNLVMLSLADLVALRDRPEAEARQKRPFWPRAIAASQTLDSS